MAQIRLRYNVNLDKIKVKLKVLEDKLNNHKIQFEKESSNWGYVGDLSYINGELDNLLKFLK
jgi:hypothetical protein